MTDAIGVGGGHDHRANIGRLGENVLEDAQTVAVATVGIVEHRVDDGQVEALPAQGVHGLGVTGGQADVITGVGQHLVEGILPAIQIVHNQRVILAHDSFSCATGS